MARAGLLNVPSDPSAHAESFCVSHWNSRQVPPVLGGGGSSDLYPLLDARIICMATLLLRSLPFLVRSLIIDPPEQMKG